MFEKINGYLLIPHEILHVIAYRLIGKRCVYQLGQHLVRPIESRTRAERVFCLLFPLLINSIAVILLLAWWVWSYIIRQYAIDPILYFQTAPDWHKALFFGWVFLLTYSATSLFDVILVWRLLTNNLSQQPPYNPNEN
jgi:hypothetical protein